jgi:hypothetical protein
MQKKLKVFRLWNAYGFVVVDSAQDVEVRH